MISCLSFGCGGAKFAFDTSNPVSNRQTPTLHPEWSRYATPVVPASSTSRAAPTSACLPELSPECAASPRLLPDTRQSPAPAILPDFAAAVARAATCRFCVGIAVMMAYPRHRMWRHAFFVAALRRHIKQVVRSEQNVESPPISRVRMKDLSVSILVKHAQPGSFFRREIDRAEVVRTLSRPPYLLS